MDEINKLPDEQNNKEVKEQSATAPESSVVDEPASKTPTPKAPKSKLPLIIGGVVAGVAAIAVSVTLILGGGKGNQGAANPPENNPPVDNNGHEHSYSEWTVVEAPTCISSGIEERACECGHNEMRRVDALGHTEVIDVAVDPTCSTAGLTEGKHCSTCGTVIIAQSDVAQLSHTYDDEYDADCNLCGEIRDVECAHAEIEVVSGTAATCEATGLTDGTRCKKCGETIVEQETIPMVSHSYDDKYDDECNICGHKRDAECAHTETETVKGYAASCTQTGLTDGTNCKKCGETIVEQNIIPMASHTETVIPAVNATCTQTGLTVGTKCSVCGTTLVAQQETPKIDHNYDDKYDESCNKCVPWSNTYSPQP